MAIIGWCNFMLRFLNDIFENIQYIHKQELSQMYHCLSAFCAYSECQGHNGVCKGRFNHVGKSDVEMS